MSTLAKPGQPAPFRTVSLAPVGPSQPMSGPTTLGNSGPPLSARVSTMQMKKISSRFPWIPMIDRLCCCCSLKTCCIAQGWFMMVTSLLIIIFFGMGMKDDCQRGGYCYGYKLFEYVWVIFFDGIIQLFVSGLFLLGINQPTRSLKSQINVHHRRKTEHHKSQTNCTNILFGFIVNTLLINGLSGLLMPYLVFLHGKIISDLHHGVYFYDQEHFPPTLTVFLLLIPLSFVVTFLACANSLRVKMAEETASGNSQIA